MKKLNCLKQLYYIIKYKSIFVFIQIFYRMSSLLPQIFAGKALRREAKRVWPQMHRLFAYRFV